MKEKSLKSLKYWDGLINGYVLAILENYSIGEDRNLEVYAEYRKEGWTMVFEWKIGYKVGNRGSWDKMPEDNEDITDIQEFYFKLDENPNKVAKEIVGQLEIIEMLPSPEDNEIEEEDEPDYE